MVKKYICLLMCLALVFSGLAGCAAGDEPEEPQEQEQEQEQTPQEGQEQEQEEQEGESDDSQMVEVFSGGLDERGFFEGVAALDIVTLPEYKGITISEADVTASGEEIEAEVDSILAENVEYEQVTDRAVEDGDTLNIDYVGSVDGVEFDGGSTQGQGTTVTIGVTSYIDDFLEQLIGHTPGENFDIEVTFPDPYQNSPDLAGKDAIFNVTINYIQGEAIERELDDELAAQYGYSSAQDMLTAIEESITYNKQMDFTDSLLSQATCDELPESVIEYMRRLDTYYFEIYSVYYGVEPDQLVQMLYGYETVDEYAQAMEENYKDMALLALAVQAICEAEGLEATVDDIAEAGAESYIELYGEPYVRNSVLNQRVVPGFIIDHGVVG